jgi:hypothetical protein
MYLDKVKQDVRSDSRSVHPLCKWTRGACRFTQLANGFFQTLVAAGATDAWFQVARECYTNTRSPLYGSAPVWFVHDEIGLEIPIPRLHEAAAEGSRVMVETMKRYIPDVLIEAEPAAMRRWTKAADAPRYGADSGRLIPEEDWRLAHNALQGREVDDVPHFFKRFGLEVMT